MTDIKTPVTILGGYLGAGKTTLVNHLLRNANGKRLAVLVNEFGALPIDADLIEAQDDDIISLSGGCVCCSYGNDLIMAMVDMAKMNPRPDHIILEASGVALPGAIVNSLSLLEGYIIDGVVVLADSETIQERSNDKFMSDTILQQFDDADIVILNKADLVNDEYLKETRTWMKTVAPSASIIESENAAVLPDVILQDFNRSQTSATSGQHHQTGQFETIHLPMEDAIDLDKFASGLFETYPDLVRAKGFVRSPDNGVKTLQLVGKRYTITPAPENVGPGIVVILSKP